MAGDVDDEIIDLAGQKLQLSSAASLAMERPNHFYAHRQGPLSDIEAFFDGQTLTLHGKGRQVHVQYQAPGTIDAPALPAGCGTAIIDGASLYRCGRTYHQRSGGQFVVV